ncbi:WhiB family transcriptional regulator [Streptomyces sp. NPDC017943]|uniref:WhiB family transcriptional regulator n=1 Tax=Streptomyces sp. NPDC017943 TaxID=3365019 RepID=UPI0037879027
MEWLRSAACVDEDPELFFPVGTAGPALRDVSAATRVCARCRVADACLTYALSNGRASGVWGGPCEEERDALLRTTRTTSTTRTTGTTRTTSSTRTT